VNPLAGMFIFATIIVIIVGIGFYLHDLKYKNSAYDKKQKNW